MTLDLPAFDRPTKATSGSIASDAALSSLNDATEVLNCADSNRVIKGGSGARWLGRPFGRIRARPRPDRIASSQVSAEPPAGRTEDDRVATSRSCAPGPFRLQQATRV